MYWLKQSWVIFVTDTSSHQLNSQPAWREKVQLNKHASKRAYLNILIDFPCNILWNGKMFAQWTRTCWLYKSFSISSINRLFPTFDKRELKKAAKTVSSMKTCPLCYKPSRARDNPSRIDSRSTETFLSLKKTTHHFASATCVSLLMSINNS